MIGIWFVRGARPLPDVTVHIMQTPGIWFVAAHLCRDEFLIVESGISGYYVRGVLVSYIVHEIPYGEIGHIAEQ